MENEKDYVRVLPTRSGNNGGNKMKLRTGIGSNRGERERELVGRNVFLFKITREGNRAETKGKGAKTRSAKGKTRLASFNFSFIAKLDITFKMNEANSSANNNFLIHQAGYNEQTCHLQRASIV